MDQDKKKPEDNEPATGATDSSELPSAAPTDAAPAEDEQSSDAAAC